MATYEVNPAGVARVRELIAARQYVLDSDWGDVQPSASDQNAFLERHSWDDYAAWHPDGRRIVTVSERDGRFDLYLWDAP